MKIGIAADHGGYNLKMELAATLKHAGHDVTDFGATEYLPEDDYPDYVIPLSRAVVAGTVERGIAICSSGVGACIAANKISGVRACLIGDSYSAHQGVEDDAMNVLCLGGRTLGIALAWELIQIFLASTFSKKERHLRRLDKVPI